MTVNEIGTEWTPEVLAAICQRLGDDPQAVLKWALPTFGNRLAIACSFGAEDVVLVDMAVRINPKVRVFYLDTDVLFPETYETRDRLMVRYGIKPEPIRPQLTLAEQAEQYGEALWLREPDQCCGIRKVEPLARLLKELDAWVTGIRRDQAPTRAGTLSVEWDAKFGLVKINPLAAWTWDQVWAYIREGDVPYNALHDQSYPSLGCIHCTRPVAPGEDPRAGRWAGFGKTECGLHPTDRK